MRSVRSWVIDLFNRFLTTKTSRAWSWTYQVTHSYDQACDLLMRREFVPSLRLPMAMGVGPIRDSLFGFRSVRIFFLPIVKRRSSPGPPPGLGPRRPPMAFMGQGRPWPVGSRQGCEAAPSLPMQSP
jgi:hypothetical protein